MKFEKGAIVTAPNGKQYTRNENSHWRKQGDETCFYDNDIKTLIQDHDWKLSYPEKPKSVFSGRLVRTEPNCDDDVLLGCHTGLPNGTEVLVIPTKNVQYDEVCTIYRGCPLLVLPEGNCRVIVVKEEGGQG